jgi:hypothetical protein
MSGAFFVVSAIHDETPYAAICSSVTSALPLFGNSGLPAASASLALPCRPLAPAWLSVGERTAGSEFRQADPRIARP